jgi:hypothetical protein
VRIVIRVMVKIGVREKTLEQLSRLNDERSIDDYRD